MIGSKEGSEVQKERKLRGSEAQKKLRGSEALRRQRVPGMLTIEHNGIPNRPHGAKIDENGIQNAPGGCPESLGEPDCEKERPGPETLMQLFIKFWILGDFGSHFGSQAVLLG